MTNYEQGELFGIGRLKKTRMVSVRLTESEYIAVLALGKDKKLGIADTFRHILADFFGDQIHGYETWRDT